MLNGLNGDHAKVPSPIDQLIAEIERGKTGLDAIRHLDPYVWPRIAALLTGLCSSDDKHETLLAFKYEIRALLKMRQDFKRDDDLGQVAEKNLRQHYSRRDPTGRPG